MGRVVPGGSRRWQAGVLVLAALGLATAAGAAEKRQSSNRKQPRAGTPTAQVYKWVDAQGVTHYGDTIPPEYARQERVVLNSYGVPIETQYPVRTAAQVAAEQAAADSARAEQARLQRDQILLSTYLSEAEIVALRDRRVELLTGQIEVTENYLGTLRGKLKTLQGEASGFKPYSSDPAARDIDPKLAAELADTLDSIAAYDKTLTDIRAKQVRLVADFAADVARFRELKAANTPP